MPGIGRKVKSAACRHKTWSAVITVDSHCSHLPHCGTNSNTHRRQAWAPQNYNRTGLPGWEGNACHHHNVNASPNSQVNSFSQPQHTGKWCGVTGSPAKYTGNGVSSKFCSKMFVRAVMERMESWVGEGKE